MSSSDEYLSQSPLHPKSSFLKESLYLSFSGNAPTSPPLQVSRHDQAKCLHLLFKCVPHALYTNNSRKSSIMFLKQSGGEEPLPLVF